MRIFAWMFLLLPLVEIYLLIQVGSEVGALTLVLWIVATGILGGMCIRYAGVATAWAVRERMARGEVPDTEMLTGVLWVIAGVLLIIPGLVTDAVGFIFLLPFTKQGLIKAMHKNYRPREFTHPPHTPHSERPDRPTVIEGEYQRRDDETK
ncbi:MAG: FxsA family protein [Thiopseudomonas sp.]|nr:FxsA family protein [Thiopseudomonas sp.]MCK9465558.1 FxsA family protein [Thiopseudomonas sp.]